MGSYAKIAITAEVAGVGSLNTLVAMDRPRTANYTRPKIVGKSELAYKAIRVKDQVQWRSEKIVWSSISKTDRDAIDTFWTAHEGVTIPFLWTVPGETSALLWHFTSKLQDVKLSEGVYTVSATVEQLTP